MPAAPFPRALRRCRSSCAASPPCPGCPVPAPAATTAGARSSKRYNEDIATQPRLAPVPVRAEPQRSSEARKAVSAYQYLEYRTSLRSLPAAGPDMPGLRLDPRGTARPPFRQPVLRGGFERRWLLLGAFHVEQGRKDTSTPVVPRGTGPNVPLRPVSTTTACVSGTWTLRYPGPGRNTVHINPWRSPCSRTSPNALAAALVR